MIFAHLSDPHFGTITLSPRQFLSKRWLGNLNLILFRQKSHFMEPLGELPELFKKLKVDYIFITGDFTSTALDSEFQQAKDFIQQFQAPTFLLPGNHDCYTRGAQRKKRFYQFFPSQGEEHLSEHAAGVFVKELKDNWWWVGLDCTLPTPYFCSYGAFSKQQAQKLEEVLVRLPFDAKVIMGNHFPLFYSQGWRHDLHRKEVLHKLLKKYPQVKLYLHGHDHRPYIKDKHKQGLPLTFNSGSISHTRHGGFYLFTLGEKNSCFSHYVREKNQWKEKSFSTLTFPQQAHHQ